MSLSITEPAEPTQAPTAGSLSEYLARAAKPRSEFHRLWDLGYRRLIPIIPPGAKISERSYLAERVGKGLDPRGKMPGRLNGDGGWVGLGSWNKTAATLADLDSWSGMGAGVGMLMGAGIVALDIDALDPATAERLEQDALKLLGSAPLRVGRWPKRLLLYAAPLGTPYRHVTFRGSTPKADGVELLSDSRQAVVAGTHPVTGKPYEWLRPLPPSAELTPITAEQIDAYFKAIRGYLPITQESSGNAPVDRSSVDQESLKGDLALIAEAVRATPNLHENVPYERWRNIAAALRGSCRDAPEVGLELFLEFSERTNLLEPETDPQYTYESLRPPFALGADYLYRQAERLGGWAGRWFETIAPEPEPLFPSVSAGWAGQPVGPRPMLTILERPDPQTIPRREWIVFPRIPLGDVTQCVGEPGIAKSTLMIRDALAVATGDEEILTGKASAAPDRLHRTGPVIVYNAEDSQDEMRRRLTAAMDAHGIRKLAHAIHLWSGLDQGELILMARDRAHEPLKRAPGADLLRERIGQTGAVLVILDPLVGLSRGAVENDTDDMNALLQLQANEAAASRTAFMTVHHTAKSSRNNAGDIGAGRGAFAIVAKVRSSFTLTHLTKDDRETYGFEAGVDVVRLDYAKSSHARKPTAPTFLRRSTRMVGNGAAAALQSPGALFESSSRTLIELHGDDAPVFEVVAAPKRAECADAAAKPDPGRQKREGVARAVLVALGNRTEAEFADAWSDVAGEFNKAGITSSPTRQKATELVRTCLGNGGCEIAVGGQLVRISAGQRGLGPKASWWISAEKIADSGAPQTTCLNGLAGHEAMKVWALWHDLHD